MKLRNFYYINKKLLEDYIAAIEGYTYEEETQKVNETSQRAAGAKAGVFGVTGDGKYEKQSSEEKERKVHISDAAKFEKLFVYLSDNEDTPLLYYEMLNSEIFDSLHRDDFIEVLVTPRFSKMKELSDTVKKISSLAEVFETITQQCKRCSFSKRYFLVLVACRHLTCTKMECRKMFLSLIAPLTTIRLNRGKRSNRLPYIFAQGQER